jgi:uroporphyrinogen decarboxylase
MTIRENYIASVLFEKSDRIPFFPGRARRSTLANWHKQGLPEDIDWYSYLTEQLGMDCPWLYSEINTGVNYRMIPEFEEKILEQKEDSRIVQDWKGNICEISNEFEVTDLRNPVDFVTRKWIKCPVESWEDWEKMKSRYNPADPERFPEDFEKRCRALNNQDRVVSFFFSGPFMQLREWLGFEGLCLAFVDKPDLVKDMIHFYTAFIAALLEEILRNVRLDYVHASEDMAYKNKTMISPEMTREFILPTWIQWGEITHDAGCPIYDVDSDGYVGELIPIWIEAGFQINDPVEVAAGNDVVAYQQQFGSKMAYLGGVDKRAMAKGGGTLTRELERLKPAVDSGGFIPSCDHGIPNDVSWPNMVDFTRMLAELTGWL